MMMLQMLMTKGVNPIVVLPDSDGIFHDLTALNIPIKVITFRMNSYPAILNYKDFLLFLPRLVGRLIVNAIASAKLASYLRDKKIDIIHTNVSVANIGYRASKKLHIPHIFHIREYVDIDFNIHYIPSIQQLRKQFHTAHSYTICITKDIQRHHQLAEENTSRVIYNGIQQAAPAIPSLQKENFFLYAGRIQPPKSLDQLLQGYHDYTRKCPKPLPLYVAGAIIDNGYYEKNIQFIRSNGIQHLVNFLGDRNDIDMLMRKAQAIIIPSRFEGFGRCMAEAMFNGCLVIGRNTGGTKEQLDNGLQLEGEEIALRYDTVEELTQHLIAVANNYSTYHSYIDRAFHTVNSLYTSESNAQQVYEFYQDIIHEKNH
jgi:glycosyltransferase involved in cell wall biosynthesis